MTQFQTTKEKLIFIGLIVGLGLSVLCIMIGLWNYYIGFNFSTGSIEEIQEEEVTVNPIVHEQVRQAQQVTLQTNLDLNEHNYDTQEESLSSTITKASSILTGSQIHISPLPNDLAAWLNVDGVDINDPVMQYTDNDFYLDHNELKQPDKWGCYYFSSNNNVSSIDELDRITIIFGHSNGNSKHFKFSVLKSFKDVDFANKNRYMYLTINGETSKWQIFSECEFPTSKVNILDVNPTDEDYRKDILLMEELSYNAYPQDVRYGDKILVLCTCTGDKKYDTRYCVCAKLISKE